MSALPPPTKFVPFPIVKRDQRAVFGVAVTFAILPVIAVALRLLARRISKRSLDASDYCIVVACVSLPAYLPRYLAGHIPVSEAAARDN